MIEETLRVIQRGAPGGCQLYDILVRLADADQPVVEPHGCPADSGFLHCHTSTILASACLIRVWTRDSISPRQWSSFWILPSISRDADSTLGASLFHRHAREESSELRTKLDTRPCNPRSAWGKGYGPNGKTRKDTEYSAESVC